MGEEVLATLSPDQTEHIDLFGNNTLNFRAGPALFLFPESDAGRTGKTNDGSIDFWINMEEISEGFARIVLILQLEQLSRYFFSALSKTTLSLRRMTIRIPARAARWASRNSVIFASLSINSTHWGSLAGAGSDKSIDTGSPLR